MDLRTATFYPRRAVLGLAAFLLSLGMASPLLSQQTMGVGVGSGGNAPTPPLVTYLRAWSGGYPAPVRVACDASGRVYVSDASSNQVSVRDALGRTLSIRSGFSSPLGLAVDSTGKTFVAEAGRGRVSTFMQNWAPLGALGVGDGEFLYPNHLVLDPPTGELYVTDSAAALVKVYGPQGNLLRFWGGYGNAPGQFGWPTGIYVSPAREVFVADQENARIQVFTPNGAFLRSFGTRSMLGSATYPRAQGITGDAQGRIYIADAFQGWVKVVDSKGNSLSTIGAFGEGAGKLNNPDSLALDPNNRLFITNYGNSRVEIFGLDGYVDPSGLFANLLFDPSTLIRDQATNPDGTSKVTYCLLRVQGVGADQIDPGSIRANNVPATFGPGTGLGDWDGSGVPKLRVAFEQVALLAVLPNGTPQVVVAGLLTNGLPFEGRTTLTVLPGGRLGTGMGSVAPPGGDRATVILFEGARR
ncbi:MAG: NHL repeat-containing protein [Acidobacteria bacterium]|nr:NHL repeat-containing protein [Acidobacteriota bacterium]